MNRDSEKKRRPWKAEWAWLALFVFLLSLHLWFPPWGRSSAHDSYSTAAPGKKAFYLLAQNRVFYAERNFDPLPLLINHLDSPYESGSVLCLLGPARYPTEEEWQRILDWVASGGSLVFAARSDDQTGFEVDHLNLKVTPLSAAGVSPINTQTETGQLQTSLLSEGKLAWQSNLTIDAPSAEPLLEYGDQVQAVRKNYGSGRIVLLAADFVFTNQSLAFKDNSVLAFRFLETAAEQSLQRVYLDEFLNSSGTPKVVGLLLEPFLRPITVQLLICLLLFAWWESRRFGPLLPSTVSARQNIVDHTDMVGHLYYRTGDGGPVLRAYLNQLTAELHLQHHRGREERALEPIARRLGRDVSELKKWLNQARQAASQKKLDRKLAARLIRRLSLLRQGQRTT